jgi:hypothetical protein
MHPFHFISGFLLSCRKNKHSYSKSYALLKLLKKLDINEYLTNMQMFKKSIEILHNKSILSVTRLFKKRIFYQKSKPLSIHKLKDNHEISLAEFSSEIQQKLLNLFNYY